MRDDPDPSITPHLLMQAYASGVFPMSDSATSEDIYWIDPRHRGIVPLDGFHVSRTLAKSLRRGDYDVALDTAFKAVVAACAHRPETWINEQIFKLYTDLFAMGHAHSLEIWRDGRLIGGVYGVAMGAAFFGESMFHRESDASKIALAYLVHRLRAGGFVLFDTQFLTKHLASLGAVEIERIVYHDRLARALRKTAHFRRPETPAPDHLIRDLRLAGAPPSQRGSR
ncbi:MAG: leucyl/phenylalanyl-tRNA--protein transferase [Pseudomonadota bacterium]